MKSIESLHVKTWIFLAVFSAILLVVGSISSSMVCQAHAAGGEFRVGICTSFKMECGTATRDGALLAAEEINARGGILGNKIRLIYADTEDEPEKGITALKRLVEKDKVHVLIGAAVSGVFLAQMDFLQPYNIIFMNTGASTPIVADKLAKNYEKYKYQFRTTINSLTMGKSLVEDEMGFMMKMGFKKFAIFAEDAAWNRGLVNYLQKGIPKLGGNITTNVNFDPQTIDFAPIFSKISASGAEVAVPLFALTDTIAMYKQYRDMKPPFRMAGYSNPGLDADYWEKTAGACLSEVNLGHHPYIPIAITPKSIPFYNKFRARFKSSPHVCTGPTYDALYILLDAAQKAKSLKTEDLIKALEETDYVGSGGRVVFDKKTHDTFYGPDHVPFMITQWQAPGKCVVLWPEKISQGKYINPPWLK